MSIRKARDVRSLTLVQLELRPISPNLVIERMMVLLLSIGLSPVGLRSLLLELLSARSRSESALSLSKSSYPGLSARDELLFVFVRRLRRARNGWRGVFGRVFFSVEGLACGLDC